MLTTGHLTHHTDSISPVLNRGNARPSVLNSVFLRFTQGGLVSKVITHICRCGSACTATALADVNFSAVSLGTGHCQSPAETLQRMV